MIASLTMMALGTFRFGVNRASYQTLTRTSAWRWATLDRAGARSAAAGCAIARPAAPAPSVASVWRRLTAVERISDTNRLPRATLLLLKPV